jgi:hypothetical protein
VGIGNSVPIFPSQPIERLGTICFEIIEVHSYGALGVERNVCRFLKRKADDTAAGSEPTGNRYGRASNCCSVPLTQQKQ